MRWAYAASFRSSLRRRASSRTSKEFDDSTRWGFPGGSEIPPYPIDDAAVHHVFPGGWIWILRFSNGLTSAGVAASDALADARRLRPGRDRVEAPARAFSDDPGPVRRSAPDAPLRPRPATPVPRRSRRRAGLGAPAVGRGVRRPASLDGLSARAPRHPSARRGTREGFRDAALRHPPRRVRRAHARGGRPLRACSSRRSTPPSGIFRSSSSCRSSTSRRPTSRSPRGASADPSSRARFCADRILEFGPALDACCRAALAPRDAKGRERLLADVARAVALVDVAGLLDTSRRNWFEAPPVSVSCAASSVPA